MIKHLKIIVQFPTHFSEVLPGNLYLGPLKIVSVAWTPLISRPLPSIHYIYIFIYTYIYIHDCDRGTPCPSIQNGSHSPCVSTALHDPAQGCPTGALLLGSSLASSQPYSRPVLKNVWEAQGFYTSIACLVLSPDTHKVYPAPLFRFLFKFHFPESLPEYHCTGLLSPPNSTQNVLTGTLSFCLLFSSTRIRTHEL